MKPEQIASQRACLQTIYDHLAQLISVGRISVQQIVPDDIREQIEKAIEMLANAISFSNYIILPSTLTSI